MTGPKITPVILCGGKGTRLWPMSRTSRPKQFLQLTGDISLFQQTLRRVSKRALYNPPVVVTNAEYRFLVAEQAQEVDATPSAILLEPFARNTAPAIVAAAQYVLSRGLGPLLLVLPSDHSVIEDQAYTDCLATAADAAGGDCLVTFGITPTSPATGFGYIEAGKPIGEGVKAVSRFVEKPPLADAERMVAAGNYYWNSGMFMFRAETLLAECRGLAPDVFEASVAAVQGAKGDLDFIRLDETAFGAAPDISIDYAVFERTQHAAIVPAAIVWSDLGSWDAVWSSNEKDLNGNVVRGPASMVATTSSLVFTEGVHVAVNGLEDIAIVASPDAVYVGRLSEAQSVGALVKKLKLDPDTASLTETHLTSYRPWGGYTSILQGERFQVKRLFVKPGRKLSLQQHHHRAEHWVVVRGTAEVTVGKTVSVLTENQSVYIPLGEVHRLANPGKMLLELIEVQTGSYLGEDDIIRIEDEFGRVPEAFGEQQKS